nr:hypothetical protein Iba_chr03eCG4120 [Ipomoea batatas]
MDATPLKFSKIDPDCHFKGSICSAFHTIFLLFFHGTCAVIMQCTCRYFGAYVNVPFYCFAYNFLWFLMPVRVYSIENSSLRCPMFESSKLMLGIFPGNRALLRLFVLKMSSWLLVLASDGSISQVLGLQDHATVAIVPQLLASSLFCSAPIL